jgi:hypothetical protein
LRSRRGKHLCFARERGLASMYAMIGRIVRVLAHHCWRCYEDNKEGWLLYLYLPIGKIVATRDFITPPMTRWSAHHQAVGLLLLSIWSLNKALGSLLTSKP